MKQTNKNSREQKIAVQKAKEQEQENMRKPINQILNAVKEDGKTLKYNIAQRLRPYFVANPDPIHNDMRLSNALLHEIRWRKKEALMYKMFYDGKLPTAPLDKYGKPMERDDCYLAYISQTQNVHIALSKLREHLTSKLLPKVDGALFTLEQFEDFVLKTEKIINELGYVLFPTEIEVIEPL